MIQNTKRKIPFILCAVAVLLLGSACGNNALFSSGESETSVSDGKGDIKLEITAPSAGELVIAPGRHFKVSGTLSGNVPEDAVMKVSLLDASGQEIRYAVADRKGTDRVVPSVIGGDLTVFMEGTDFSEVAYTAPELAVVDTNDPGSSAHDATVKCVYTDETFYALIVSATDPEHGLTEADGYELADHEGRPYDAFPEGKYTVKAELSSVNGSELASASEEIEIGRKAGTIIHEITTPDSIQKGGMDLLTAWAADENLTILGDLLPGMFGPYYQMSTMQMSVECETAEYLPGKIKMLLYGNTAISASYCLEVAKYLQLEHNVENPEIASYYVFDLGEPSFGGKKAEILQLGDDESIHICRIDHVDEKAKDGIFLTDEEQILGSDTDPSDGWTAGEGAFAVAGAIKPYQLRDDELVPDENIYGFYQFLNGADTLVYTFTPSDGSDTFSITKPVSVSRVDETGAEAELALYEFYNVFPAGTLETGKAYDVSIQAYDRKKEAIEGAVCEFVLNR